MGGALGSATGAGGAGWASGVGSACVGIGGAGAGAFGVATSLCVVGLAGVAVLAFVGDSELSLGPAVQALKKKRKRSVEDTFMINSASCGFRVLRQSKMPDGHSRGRSALRPANREEPKGAPHQP
jgi:hypothetical protein